ncbi:OmpA family protein [Pseudomonas sp. Marseille-Q5115]|uniref:OmpA family protein n=1 Tax=Pseudomonas sp. Marseille-Q5115 TaxID=2866593 RepID=UPI001CE412C0|nr:OmpA family protein [Pseudomonas sp. Marseille-Q5115]
MKKLIVSALVIASLSGCAAIQNEDGSTKKAATYGGGAALVGAAAGALLGNARGAAIGAAVAGTAGAAYGHYVDNQEAELRQRMSGTGVEVERNGDQIKLVMPGAITFPTGKADIQPSFYNTLGQLSGSFSNFPDSNLIVTGHTDSTGSADANLGLSALRAEAVAQYLRASGIDSSRIQTTGVGSSQPVASNATPEGRAQNRRVEINVVPRQVAQR